MEIWEKRKIESIICQPGPKVWMTFNECYEFWFPRFVFSNQHQSKINEMTGFWNFDFFSYFWSSATTVRHYKNRCRAWWDVPVKSKVGAVHKWRHNLLGGKGSKFEEKMIRIKTKLPGEGIKGGDQKVRKNCGRHLWMTPKVFLVCSFLPNELPSKVCWLLPIQGDWT